MLIRIIIDISIYLGIQYFSLDKSMNYIVALKFITIISLSGVLIVYDKISDYHIRIINELWVE